MPSADAFVPAHAGDQLDDQRAIRVFVSSTFRDMQLERDELVKRVFPRLRRLCEERGVTWSEVDLRWGVTDEQKSEGAVLPICLAEIERTRPYFIGLLGQRYGWVPDEIPSELVDELGWLVDDTGRSVTELEILHGVLNNPDAAGHAFFYLREPAWVDTIPDAERATFVEESPAGARRLAELRERIQTSVHPSATYASPERVGDQLFTDFESLIDRLYPVDAPDDPAARVRATHDAFGRARYRLHVDRPDVRSSIDRSLTDGRPILVTGQPGAGASSLVTNWAWGMAEGDVADVVIHHVDANPEAADYRHLTARIAWSLGAGDVEPPVDSVAARNQIMKSFRHASRRTIIVIDGVDRLDDTDGAPDLRWMPTSVPAHVQVVFTAAGERQQAAASARRWPIVEVPPLDVPDRRSIAVEVLAVGSKALDADNLAALSAADGCGNARYLRTVLDELRQHGDHFTLRARIDQLTAAASVDDLLELVLARYETDFERDRPGLTRDVFTLLWAARKGVAESELSDMLGTAGDRLPAAIWSPLHLAAEQGIVTRGGLLGIAHADLRRAVEDRYLPTAAERRSAHARLAAYFAAQPMSGRVADELAWQYAAAEQHEALRAALSNLEFVELSYRRNPADVRRLWVKLVAASDAPHADIGAEMLTAYRPVVDDPAAYDTPGAQRQLVWGVARLLADAGQLEAAMSLQRWILARARIDPRGTTDGPGGTSLLRASLVNLGASQYATGALDAAAESLSEAAALCRSAGASSPADAGLLDSALSNLGLVRRDQGNRDEAGSLFAEAEQLGRASGDDFALQATLGNHAQLLRELGRYDDALAMMREQESLCRLLGDTKAVAVSLGGQATVLADRGDLAGALELMERQLEVVLEDGDSRGIAEAQLNVGFTRLQLGDLAGAATALDDAETLARRLGAPTVLSRVLASRANLAGATGDWPAAERVASEAALTAQQAGLDAPMAIALGTVGTARRELGNLPGALQAHTDELAAAQRSADEHAVAIAQTNLGNVAIAHQNFDDALARYQWAEAVFRRLDVPSSLVPLLANRAQIHHAFGRNAEALADYTDAAECAARLGNVGAVASWADGAITLAYQLGDVGRAERLWPVLAQSARQRHDDAALQRALGEHALLLINRAQPVGVVGNETNTDQRLLHEASLLLDEQDAVCRRSGDDVGLAACVGNRAIVCRYRGDLAGSLACLDEQLATAIRSGNGQGALFATANRGEVLGLLGRTNEARAALSQARATAQQHGLAPMVQQLDAMIAALPPV